MVYNLTDVKPKTNKQGTKVEPSTGCKLFRWFSDMKDYNAFSDTGPRDFPGGVVTITDLESLALYHFGFESSQRLWILSCEEAIQLAYRMSDGGSTQVPAHT